MRGVRGVDGSTCPRAAVVRPRAGTPPVKIVSIAPYMPFPGIPHAGGEFYRRHAELVAQSHDLVVVAPRNAENEAALAQDDEAPYRRLLVTPQVPRGGLRSAYHFLMSRVVPFLAVRPFWR